MNAEKSAADNEFKIFFIIIGFVLLLGMCMAGSCGVFAYFSYKPLIAKTYYTKGVDYKHKGWIVKSKNALNKAISYDKNGIIGEKADHFLKTRLPKSNNISPEAIQKNIYGYNEDVKGNYSKAISYFTEAIELSPEFEWPYNNLARIYTKQKKYNKAIELFEKALQLNPDYYNAYLNFGYLYWKRGYEYHKNKQYQKALVDYKKALKIYSKASIIEPDDRIIQKDIRSLEKNISALKAIMKPRA